MSDTTEAPVDYDADVWIEVPLEFPTGDIATADEWADLLAADATRGSATATETLAPIRDAALAIAGYPRGLASRRYWFFPLDAQTVSIVQHFELPRDAALDEVLLDFLGEHDSRSTDPVVTESISAHGERVVTVAFLARENPDDVHGAVFGVVRVARVSDDSVDLFELVDEDLAAASAVIGHLEVLAASVGRGEYAPPPESTP